MEIKTDKSLKLKVLRVEGRTNNCYVYVRVPYISVQETTLKWFKVTTHVSIVCLMNEHGFKEHCLIRITL